MEVPWWISGLCAVDLLRLFYLVSSMSILLVSFTPSLSSRFLAYGARAAPTKPQLGEGVDSVSDVKSGSESCGFGVLDVLASITVPHAWFYHFYVVSTFSSLIWLHQILTRGPWFQAIAASRFNEECSMTVSQVALCWALLFFQGCRRLYECLTLFKPSSSRMWLGHYAIGIAFYIATGMAIWVEGVPALKSSANIYVDVHAGLTASIVNNSLFVLIFLTASKAQHDCHTYLSSLQKYTLPTEGAFHHLIAPHYTAECVIYLCLTHLAAPTGIPLNKTMQSALLFVACNLGSSARGTKRWMEQTFGRENISRRWTVP